MKIKELLTEIFGEDPSKDHIYQFDGLTLYGRDNLEQYKERILQCDEFSECTELNFMNLPMILFNDNEPIKAMDFKLVEGQKFKGVCYLLSLALTPEVFNPDTLHTPVKDGACITPLVYNPETFKPLRKIVLEYSPERVQDGIVDGEYELKMEMKSLLDKVLDNPYDYQVKGERGVIVRGVFERNEVVKELTPARYLTGVKSFINEKEFPDRMAFYYESIPISEGEVEIKLKCKIIPSHLSKLYVETFGESNFQVTEEEINKFLEDNSND